MTDNTRDEPDRYDRLGPIARALVDDHDASDLAEMLVKVQDQLAALRQVSRGYCPDCGRGDAAPTVTDWEQQRDRARKAEQERDEARQHTAAIAAQRDRLRQRMNHLADRWEYALAVDKPYGRTLRSEISVAPFCGTSTAVRPYRADDGSQKWATRCWGTEACDGWLSLDHDTERWAEIARDRHVAEAHAAPTDDAELTAQEARDLADELSTDLYRAQDRLAFIAELLDAAEQDGTTTVDISRVRGWLDGPKCGMQMAAENPGLYEKLTEAVLTVRDTEMQRLHALLDQPKDQP